MAETIWMRADEISNAFNTAEDKQYWRASIAGTRLRPEVNFNSRASMVTVTYHIYTERFTVAFSKSAVAWGDYLASVYRSMHQILTTLKAAGLPFPEPDAECVLMVEYNPKSKLATLAIKSHADAWADIPPMPFKGGTKRAELTPDESAVIEEKLFLVDDAKTNEISLDAPGTAELD